jgi:hypothetical protein
LMSSYFLSLFFSGLKPRGWSRDLTSFYYKSRTLKCDQIFHFKY